MLGMWVDRCCVFDLSANDELARCQMGDSTCDIIIRVLLNMYWHVLRCLQDWSWGATNNLQCTTNPYKGQYCLCTTLTTYGAVSVLDLCDCWNWTFAKLGRQWNVTWSPFFSGLSFAIRSSSNYLNTLRVGWQTLPQVRDLTIPCEWLLAVGHY
jgi:hypothetical protein